VRNSLNIVTASEEEIGKISVPEEKVSREARTQKKIVSTENFTPSL
jgi:hypothetical protein